MPRVIQRTSGNLTVHPCPNEEDEVRLRTEEDEDVSGPRKTRTSPDRGRRGRLQTEEDVSLRLGRATLASAPSQPAPDDRSPTRPGSRPGTGPAHVLGPDRLTSWDRADNKKKFCWCKYQKIHKYSRENQTREARGQLNNWPQSRSCDLQLLQRLSCYTESGCSCDELDSPVNNEFSSSPCPWLLTAGSDTCYFLL
ncbi:unnamed protein product [Pleuronectes platessa]|uniref:Uncharacterized protein n=1 Tax=Pleuronectes platessa TaxID=8262 RepID=A0A9N7VW82_PLEPL|nr:unnamed protein product [Pleuronectes platessa]